MKIIRIDLEPKRRGYTAKILTPFGKFVEEEYFNTDYEEVLKWANKKKEIIEQREPVTIGVPPPEVLKDYKEFQEVIK